MAKTLPNINKPVPEATDPALIKPVSDAIEAVDQAIGAKPSTLTTTAKTIVPAVNEIKGQVDTLEANSSLLRQTLTGTHFQYVVLNKVGKVVTIIGGMTITQAVPAGTNTIIGALPEGFRPRDYVELFRPCGAISPNPVRLRFTQSGDIQLYIYGATSLPVGSTVDCCVSFIIPD